MRISLSDEAEADANAATDWYIGYGAFVADRTRMLTLYDFPYSLIYRIQGDEIRVIAVAHHSRRPGYWVGRR
jgi:hypothetical protein